MTCSQDIAGAPTAGHPEPSVRVIVDGIPAPGGSKTMVPVPGILKSKAREFGGRLYFPIGTRSKLELGPLLSSINIKDSGKGNAEWKKKVAASANAQLPSPRNLLNSSLVVHTVFVMPRPKGHYLTGGGLSAEGRRHPVPTVMPDALKLMRSTEDALTGVVWKDDAIIAKHIIDRVYEQERGNVGAIITIRPWRADDHPFNDHDSGGEDEAQ